MDRSIKMYLVGVEGVGKSTLAEELKSVLLRYGVKEVVSVHHDSAIRVRDDAYVEWKVL